MVPWITKWKRSRRTQHSNLITPTALAATRGIPNPLTYLDHHQENQHQREARRRKEKAKRASPSHRFNLEVPALSLNRLHFRVEAAVETLTPKKLRKEPK